MKHNSTKHSLGSCFVLFSWHSQHMIQTNTVNKWYKLERNPIEVLEGDPDLVRRAQDMDVPFEPGVAAM